MFSPMLVSCLFRKLRRSEPTQLELELDLEVAAAAAQPQALTMPPHPCGNCEYPEPERRLMPHPEQAAGALAEMG